MAVVLSVGAGPDPPLQPGGRVSSQTSKWSSVPESYSKSSKSDPSSDDGGTSAAVCSGGEADGDWGIAVEEQEKIF